MWWIAFAPPPSPPEPPLAWWALGFSPRVCGVDEAVLLEAQASERLFGGRRALLLRLRAEAQAQGVPALACAPTALAALALLREAQRRGLSATGCGSRTLAQRLDALPLATLRATAPHHDTLHALGCHRLGALRALPRAGVARRFGADLLAALDRAYGEAPDGFDWLTLPERFDESLDCPAAVETGPGLLFGVQRLLQRLLAWLRARKHGATALTLHWQHDSRRALTDGVLPVRSATPTQDTTHLGRLLAEHLARTTLAAPVRRLRLVATSTEPLASTSHSLLPEPGDRGEPLHRFIERVGARLGADHVLMPHAVADHRPERMTRWLPADGTAPPRPAPGPHHLMHQPPWLLREPVRLPLQGNTPCHHGPLTLLAGPERLETGWWPEDDAQGEHDGSTRLRDYYLAESPGAGLLWVFQLLRTERPAWFLHGIYG